MKGPIGLIAGGLVVITCETRTNAGVLTTPRTSIKVTIFGPGGATETKPVGLVYVGLNGGGGDVITRGFRFHGDRQVIKQRSSQAALDLLRRWVLDRGGL